MAIYYLYIKTHNVTGLNYLGQTTAKDPHKYKGSGTYWKRHIKKYGYDCTTIILRECNTREELATYGLYYSQLWNIIESKDWANLCMEDGKGSTGHKYSNEQLQKKSARVKGENNPMYGKPSPFRGQTHTPEVRKHISEKTRGRPGHNKGQKMSPEFCAKISQNHHDVSGENNPMYGKTHAYATKLKMSLQAKNRVVSEDQKNKISRARKGKPWTEERRKAKMISPRALWELIDPEGNIFETRTLKQFCANHGLNYRLIKRYTSANRPLLNGWVARLIDDSE